jgi:SAM-dependent methyltransferase
MLPRHLRGGGGDLEADEDAATRRRTGESFGYEWEHFGQLRPEWRMNFLGYMQPHAPEFFDGIKVLDVGTGSGRHATEAAALGSRVAAVDIGSSIEVARRNLPDDVMTVQADAEQLPFEDEGFDFVMSIGVLHHLPDPARALNGLVRLARRGGRVHVYLYWWPARRVHRLILRIVAALRRITTRLPHPLLHALCYPLALLLWLFVVTPFRILRGVPRLSRLADAFPLKAYADYPFGVLVNDQFDRFSAPIERRFTRREVEQLMREAGLVEVTVTPHHGWVADGRRP